MLNGTAGALSWEQSIRNQNIPGLIDADMFRRIEPVGCSVYQVQKVIQSWMVKALEQQWKESYGAWALITLTYSSYTGRTGEPRAALLTHLLTHSINQSIIPAIPAMPMAKQTQAIKARLLGTITKRHNRFWICQHTS